MLLANAVLRPLGLTRMGLSPDVLRRGLVQGLIGGIIVVPFIFFVAEATQLVWQVIHYEHPKEHDLLRLMGQSDHLIEVVLIASAVLVAPLFEELLFRGHLQTVVTHAALAGLTGRSHRIAGVRRRRPDGCARTQATPDPDGGPDGGGAVGVGLPDVPDLRLGPPSLDDPADLRPLPLLGLRLRAHRQPLDRDDHARAIQRHQHGALPVRPALMREVPLESPRNDRGK